MCGTTRLDELFKRPLRIKLKALSRLPPQVDGRSRTILILVTQRPDTERCRSFVLHDVIVGFMAQKKKSPDILRLWVFQEIISGDFRFSPPQTHCQTLGKIFATVHSVQSGREKV